jgi:hypothetical protein
MLGVTVEGPQRFFVCFVLFCFLRKDEKMRKKKKKAERKKKHCYFGAVRT